MMARCSVLVLCILSLILVSIAFGPSPFSRNSKRAFGRPTAVARQPSSLFASLDDNGEKEKEEEEPNENDVDEPLEVEAMNDDEEEEAVTWVVELPIEPSASSDPMAGETVFAEAVYDEEEDEDDDDDDEEEDDDHYSKKASEEFLERATSGLDWGGALGTLRERVSDVESGASQSPSNALFRVMTSQTPNEAIGNFISTADRQVVAAMSGAVSSLLGGLSNPAMGVETVVKASGEKIGSLCFQLQMTG